MVPKPLYLHHTPWKHTCGIILVDLEAQNFCLTCLPDGGWLWTRGIPAYARIFNSKYKLPSYSVLIAHKLPTTSCMRSMISFSTPDRAEMPAGFTRTPRTSRLFWWGESVPGAAGRAPACVTRQGRCQLPDSSSHLHKHPLAICCHGSYTAQHCC